MKHIPGATNMPVEAIAWKYLRACLFSGIAGIPPESSSIPPNPNNGSININPINAKTERKVRQKEKRINTCINGVYALKGLS